MWKLAHRPRDESTPSTQVVLDTDSSAEAIEQLRRQIPNDHVILYVMESDRPAPK